MLRFLSVLAMSAAMVLSAAAARADWVYAFDASNYAVTAGDTVDVNVYLYESGVSSSASDLKNTGLAGVGVRVNFDNNVQVSTDDGTSSGTPDIAASNKFGLVFTQTTDMVNDYAVLWEGSSSNAKSSTTHGTGYWISIGTFTFTAGSLNGVTTISATQISTAFGETSDGTYVLDNLIANATATITVTGGTDVTPEPSTLALCGMATLAFAGYRIRRRK